MEVVHLHLCFSTLNKMRNWCRMARFRSRWVSSPRAAQLNSRHYTPAIQSTIVYLFIYFYPQINLGFKRMFCRKIGTIETLDINSRYNLLMY